MAKPTKGSEELNKAAGLAGRALACAKQSVRDMSAAKGAIMAGISEHARLKEQVGRAIDALEEVCRDVRDVADEFERLGAPAVADPSERRKSASADLAGALKGAKKHAEYCVDCCIAIIKAVNGGKMPELADAPEWRQVYVIETANTAYHDARKAASIIARMLAMTNAPDGDGGGDDDAPQRELTHLESIAHHSAEASRQRFQRRASSSAASGSNSDSSASGAAGGASGIDASAMMRNLTEVVEAKMPFIIPGLEEDEEDKDKDKGWEPGY